VNQEDIMKSNLMFAALGGLLGILLVATPAAQAANCMFDNVAGSYGYTSAGTIVSPAVGPFAAVGRVTLSSSGAVDGVQTTSIAGIFFDETISGTYSVSLDCTGTATVDVFHATTKVRTTQLNIVWDDKRNEFRFIFLTAGTVITATGRKIAPVE
jgi:hypothetical protein